MAPPQSSSLPSKGRSTSSINQPNASSSSTQEPDEVLHRITSLSSSLPPIAPTHADLNPLIDLISLFQHLPLQPPPNTTSTSSWYQLNRQAVHTSLHALKATFEALINHGRLHGVLKRKIAPGQGASSSSSKEQAALEMASVQKVKEWLQERWADYLKQTATVVQGHWDMGVRVRQLITIPSVDSIPADPPTHARVHQISALNALMSLLRTESTFLTSLHHSRQAQFPSSTLVHILRAILLPQDDEGLIVPEIKDEWQKWWNVCDDIRYHFLKGSATLLSSYASSNQDVPTHLVSNMITLFESLTSMPTVPKELNEWWCSTPTALKSKGDKSNKKRKTETGKSKDDGSTGIFDSSSSSESDENAPKMSARDSKKLLPPLLSLSAHRRVFQDCVLALLSLPLDEAQSKRVLSILHRQVLPHMTDPKRLMDWLVDCTTQGGTIAILALNGLFTLMQKHNLEYPNFYSTLYSLLTRSLLHTRYRPRFFRLLIIFLSSTHISASLVASFIKRLSRLALSAPPSAIVTIVPLVYNLLKLHPGCMTLIHNPSPTDETIHTDPFDPEEKDPNLTRALESSLWEIQSLMQHYLASVAGLAKVFKEVMNKERYGMEDFLDHSFATMFETEATRLIRNAPALAPVPQRQPIGDSFFPSTPAAERPTKVVKKVVKRSLLEDEGDEEEVEVEQGPVDTVARLWVF
ncbi:BQ5605_C012g06834 [Microbotryum silenes-dioicae]|uniref:BQ5605_C012g06834 protein n=1 Tax=Microbotryum silenes-dioicae TaxID=796604 RepID=A0A2X0LW95_9BASI|nr:BQ5605_C012g06834 [Microbotryum silenes-dioicae]